MRGTRTVFGVTGSMVTTVTSRREYLRGVARAAQVAGYPGACVSIGEALGHAGKVVK